jgi:predicted Ser/Thr protein kinase
MTQDEIIEMARQAHISLVLPASPRALETFAALVAAKEQKKWEDQTAVEIHEAVLEEREACAKLADEYATYGGSKFYDWFKKLAIHIRARGKQA